MSRYKMVFVFVFVFFVFVGNIFGQVNLGEDSIYGTHFLMIDVNGDNIDDIVKLRVRQDVIRVYTSIYNKNSGKFGTINHVLNDSHSSIIIGFFKLDYDGDGDVDFARNYINDGRERVRIIRNNGNGTFTRMDSYDIGDQYGGLVDGTYVNKSSTEKISNQIDVNGDGKDDILKIDWGGRHDNYFYVEYYRCFGNLNTPNLNRVCRTRIGSRDDRIFNNFFTLNLNNLNNNNNRDELVRIFYWHGNGLLKFSLFDNNTFTSHGDYGFSFDTNLSNAIYVMSSNHNSYEGLARFYYDGTGETKITYYEWKAVDGNYRVRKTATCSIIPQTNIINIITFDINADNRTDFISGGQLFLANETGPIGFDNYIDLNPIPSNTSLVKRMIMKFNKKGYYKIGVVTIFKDSDGDLFAQSQILGDQNPPYTPDASTIKPLDGVSNTTYKDPLSNNWYTNQADGVTLTWDAVNDRGNMGIKSGINFYRVRADEFDVIKTSGNVLELELPSINGNIYNYLQVRAIDKARNASEWSSKDTNVALIVDLEGPEAPADFNLFGNSINIDDKVYISDTDNISFTWTELADLPVDNHAGINSSNYLLELNNLSTVITVNSIISFPMTEGISIAESGHYQARLQAFDNLLNAGEYSESCDFYIDNEASDPPSIESIQLTDPDASRMSFNNKLAFYTGETNLSVTWEPSSDGTEDWQSGVKEYYCKLTRMNDSVQIFGGTVSENIFSIDNLSYGKYQLNISSIDNVGNQGEEIQITIYIMTPYPVTFPDSCYELIDDEYYFRWNAAESNISDENEEWGIDYYKFIIIEDPEVFFLSGNQIETENDFDDLGTVMVPGDGERLVSISDSPQGQELCAFVLAVDNLGHFSIGSKKFTLPPLNVGDDGDDGPYVLPEDEYWWEGIHNVYVPIIVPEGVTLHILPGTIVKIFGHQDAIGEGNIFIAVQGAIKVYDEWGGVDGGSIIFESERLSGDIVLNKYRAWKGIYINGEGTIEDCIIQNAVRGVTVVEGSEVTINGCVFRTNLFGVHAYGSGVLIENTEFHDYKWYGVKEDAITDARPQLLRCIFYGKGYDYYHLDNLNITMEELNAILGNEENERREE